MACLRALVVSHSAAWALSALLAASSLTGCAATTGSVGPTGAPTSASTAVSSAPASTPSPHVTSSRAGSRPSAEARPSSRITRVLAISVDGLNPRAISRLGPKGAPAFRRLMREGSWTFNARTEQEMTITLPNHTGMLTSRRIDDRRGGHGVTFNSDNGGTVHQAAGHYVASVFDVVHDHGRSTALFAAKTKFALYARTWNRSGRADSTGADNGRAKIDAVVIDTDNRQLVARLEADLRRSPETFTFLHISLPDVAGHAHGFMSRDYVDAVKATDVLLGRVLATIATRQALRQSTLVLLTADHGGNGPTHSDATKLQNYRIPFLAWGPGVPAGRDLYAMNPGFADPGTARPGYGGKQPIRNGDVANLVTDVLSLPAVPGSQLDRARTLSVFGR